MHVDVDVRTAPTHPFLWDPPTHPTSTDWKQKVDSWGMPPASEMDEGVARAAICLMIDPWVLWRGICRLEGRMSTGSPHNNARTDLQALEAGREARHDPLRRARGEGRRHHGLLCVSWGWLLICLGVDGTKSEQ